jgi:hypothetical protein
MGQVPLVGGDALGQSLEVGAARGLTT